MSGKLRLLLSLMALFLGVSILGVSLSSVHPVLSSSNEFQASQKQVYMKGEILPDHLAYPVLMAADRVQLLATPESELPRVQIQYGLRRLHAAQALHEQGKTELAVTTLTKSQKYMLYATQELRQAELTQDEAKQLLVVLTKYTQEVHLISDELEAQQKNVVEQLITELEAAQGELKTEIAE